MVKFICVHGNIGAGKSTFIENISEQCPDINYVCLQEPLDKWGSYLQKYYDALELLQQLPLEEIRQPTKAQTIKAQQDIINFEVIITNIRLQQYTQIRQLRYNSPKYVFLDAPSGLRASYGGDGTQNQQELIKETAYIFERSIEESWLIFCQTLQRYLTDEQWSFLKYFFETAIQQEVKFDSEIYLEATTDELFRRIHKRGRKEESDISFEYLDTLNETYKKYAKKFSK